MIFSEAQAETSAPGPVASNPGSPLGSFADIMPLLFMAVLFYFLLIRPQQKKIKQHDQMTLALRRGDKVVTSGGVIGTIQKLEGDDIVVLEIAPEVRVRVLRETVASVYSKTIANDNKADDKEKSR
jgi:preprotein translocase subunit YajC